MGTLHTKESTTLVDDIYKKHDLQCQRHTFKVYDVKHAPANSHKYFDDGDEQEELKPIRLEGYPTHDQIEVWKYLNSDGIEVRELVLYKSTRLEHETSGTEIRFSNQEYAMRMNEKVMGINKFNPKLRYYGYLGLDFHNFVGTKREA